jgi:hypothetical protein
MKAPRDRLAPLVDQARALPRWAPDEDLARFNAALEKS